MTSNITHISLPICCRYDVTNSALLSTAHRAFTDKVCSDKLINSFTFTLIMKKREKKMVQPSCALPRPQVSRCTDLPTQFEENKEYYSLNVVKYVLQCIALTVLLKNK